MVEDWVTQSLPEELEFIPKAVRSLEGIYTAECHGQSCVGKACGRGHCWRPVGREGNQPSSRYRIPGGQRKQGPAGSDDVANRYKKD